MWSSAALPQAPQVKRCFVIPHSITSVSVFKEQMKGWCCLRICSFFFLQLCLFPPTNWACHGLSSQDSLCPKGYCFAMASSHISFEIIGCLSSLLTRWKGLQIVFLCMPHIYILHVSVFYPEKNLLCLVSITLYLRYEHSHFHFFGLM